MAAFEQAFSIIQSADGLTLTLLDGSNWIGNDEGYLIGNFTRQVVLNDSLGNPIATVPFVGVSLSATYPISTNRWISAISQIIGAPNFNLTQKYAFYRLFQLAFKNALSGNCGRGLNGIDFGKVDSFLEGAEMAIPVGNGVEFDNFITKADAYLQRSW